MPPLLQVAIGGAAGASLRYLAGIAAMRLSPSFPVATLGVNVAGSFAMGLLAAVLGRAGLAHLSPLLLTGVLGGFTTFSAFSLDAVQLWERGQGGQALLYVALSVLLSIGGLVLGLALGRAA